MVTRIKHRYTFVYCFFNNLIRVARLNGRGLIYDIWNQYLIDRVYNTVGSFDVRLNDFGVVDKQVVVFN